MTNKEKLLKDLKIGCGVARPVRSPRGTQLHCKGWYQEAALRMLCNNLDPDNAENPDELIVYGGLGKAARNWHCFDVIIKTLLDLENDETLLIQSGKPVGVLKTHTNAPRVLMANANIVPQWANWDTFHELDKKGLIMYGQMTAGSWIYIGTQGILQGTYETFAALGRKHYHSDLTGKIVVTAGLGGMGGAQPLSVTMANGVAICIEINPTRIKKRLDKRYLDIEATSLDQAIATAQAAAKNGTALSIGLCANVCDILPAMIQRDFIPDVITDQTSAHDELNGYFPQGLSLEAALTLRKTDPKTYKDMALNSMALHVKAILELQKKGAIAFDYGNNLRAQAMKRGVDNAMDYPGFVPAYIRELFCRGEGPFRWAALSGDPEDIRVTDRELIRLFPKKTKMINWLKMAEEKVEHMGLPTRICWLGYGEREQAGKLFNDLVRDKKVKAPIVIGRDHLDCGSVASPYRETEAMKDGSDAVADWALLNCMTNVASGATWVSFHDGGGVGIGYALHAGQVTVADGTLEAENRLITVLRNDPGTGIIRHADAGYETAIDVAHAKGINLPMINMEP
ncbi:MAG: urocanate hydratase [Desulfobacula sp.]|nr:urocanate hydratase [Desulfobacula sp.]